MRPMFIDKNFSIDLDDISYMSRAEDKCFVYWKSIAGNGFSIIMEDVWIKVRDEWAPKPPSVEEEKIFYSSIFPNCFIKMTTNIEDLEFTVRTYNCLKSEDIFSVNQLISSSEITLLKIPNFGIKSLIEVKEVLNRYGLSLKN